jgi:hypothetical protein
VKIRHGRERHISRVLEIAVEDTPKIYLFRKLDRLVRDLPTRNVRDLCEYRGEDKTKTRGKAQDRLSETLDF